MTTAVGTMGALVLELGSFQAFLFLLGSFFVPLFAVLLADWLASGARYKPEDVFDGPPMASAPSSRGSPASPRTNGSRRPGLTGGSIRSGVSIRPTGG